MQKENFCLIVLVRAVKRSLVAVTSDLSLTNTTANTFPEASGQQQDLDRFQVLLCLSSPSGQNIVNRKI